MFLPLFILPVNDGQAALVVQITGKTLNRNIGSRCRMHKHAPIAYGNTFAAKPAAQRIVRYSVKISGKRVFLAFIVVQIVPVAGIIGEKLLLARAQGQVLPFAWFVKIPARTVDAGFTGKPEVLETYSLYQNKGYLVIP